MLGMVPFHRTRIQGNWTPHIHTVLNGMGCVDPYARGQIVECKNGGDGLKGGLPDPDIHLRSGLWPLARYQGRTGKLRALAGTHMRSLPTYNSDNLGTKVIGQTVNALMEVRVPAEYIGGKADQIWFVTDQGEWGISSKWKAA